MSQDQHTVNEHQRKERARQRKEFARRVAGIVQHVNECVHENDQGVTYNICGLDEATSSHRLSQPGDSGGPVLSNLPDGSVHVSGLISGGNTAGTDLLFTDIVRFEGAFGGAPAHG